MAHPMKVKSFVYTEDFVEWLPILKEETKGYYSGKKIWSQGVCFKADEIYSDCEIVPFDRIVGEVLLVSYKNQAPTKLHPTFHQYGVYVKPFDIIKPFSIGESIGGGHIDYGPGWELSLRELLLKEDWKVHFSLSGCAWAIEIIEKSSSSTRPMIDSLTSEIRRRASLHLFEE
jgi:hypothetical protein